MTMTLDGFLSGPHGELDWFDPSKSDPETINDVVAILDSSQDWMMGYPTGPGMIAFWSQIEKKGEADEWEMRIARSANRLHPIFISIKREKETEGTELVVVRSDTELVKALGIVGGCRGCDLDTYIRAKARDFLCISRIFWKAELVNRLLSINRILCFAC